MKKSQQTCVADPILATFNESSDSLSENEYYIQPPSHIYLSSRLFPTIMNSQYHNQFHLAQLSMVGEYNNCETPISSNPSTLANHSGETKSDNLIRWVQIGPRNLMGHIINAQDPVYTVSTSHGTNSASYARNFKGFPYIHWTLKCNWITKIRTIVVIYITHFGSKSKMHLNRQ